MGMIWQSDYNLGIIHRVVSYCGLIVRIVICFGKVIAFVVFFC